MVAEPGALTAAFVEALQERFAYAASHSDEVQHHRLSMGGRQVELTIIGDALAERFMPALRHGLTTTVGQSPGDLDLQLLAWDRRAADVAPPSFPWEVDDILANSRVKMELTDPVIVDYDRWVRLLSLYDPRRRLGVVHAADARTLPKWMERSPFRSVLTKWCTDQGDAVLHAATVVAAGRAVVLAGASGSGKSTSMMRCLEAGLATLGDDACIVSTTGRPTVRPMFGLAKLECETVHRSAGDGWRRHGDEDGRPVFELGDALVPAAELRTIAITELSPSVATSWSELAPAAALRGLVDGSVAEGAGLSLAAIRRLVTSVRCVRLRLGSDPAAVVDAISELAR